MSKAFLPLLIFVALSQAVVGELAADLGSVTRNRVSQVLDSKRAALQNPKLDNLTTPAQALAVNQLLGVNTIPGWPTGHFEEMGASNGMCRVSQRRPWDFPFDHGLHCNIVQEWYFFVGSFDVGETVIGFELMFVFEKLTPSATCKCEYGQTHTAGQQIRLSDPSGRLAESQFAVVVAPKAGNGSAVGSSAKHVQAKPTVRMWTGLADDEAVSAPWGFRIGSFEMTALSDDLRDLRVLSRDDEAGIAVNLTLQRSYPFMFQGGDGYIGSPETGNGEAYYSITGAKTQGVVTALGHDYVVADGYTWMDHQFGTIGVPQQKSEADIVYAAYLSGVNINPVNMGFGVPGTENWFGFHFNNGNGSYIGAFCGIYVDRRTWDLRTSETNLTLKEAQFLGADGTQTRVNYTYSIVDYFVTPDGSMHGRSFCFQKVVGTESAGLPTKFCALSVAADSRCSWASGGTYYEGAVELQDSNNNVIGHGYTEGVGWDRKQISEVVRTALRLERDPTEEEVGLLSSRPPKTSPPPKLADRWMVI